MFQILKHFAIAVYLAGFSFAGEIPERELPEGTVKVVAYLYDYTAADTARIEAGGKLHPGVIPKFTTTLSKADTQIMLDAFTEKHPPHPRYACEFAPHHGFVFYGEGEKILGSVSVCFQCRETYSRQFDRVREPFSTFWDWDAIKGLFVRNGIPILDSNDDYTALRKEKDQQAKSDQPATAPRSKQEGNDKHQPASKPAPR